MVLWSKLCRSLSSTAVIGWQFATYQAAEGTATVQACAEVLNGAANIGTRTIAITVQLSTNPGTAQGRQVSCNDYIHTSQLYMH